MRPGMESKLPAVEAWGPNHWMAGEFSHLQFLSKGIGFLSSQPQFFTIEKDVCYGFVVYGLYYVELPLSTFSGESLS